MQFGERMNWEMDHTKTINADKQADIDMEGNAQIIDAFWNGLDVFLDLSSSDLFELWPDEFNKQSCNLGRG